MEKKTNSPSILFFGTSEFSVVILNALHKAGFTPQAVVTPEDKPQGRSLILTSPPAKRWAEERNIPVLQPQKLNEDFFLEVKKGGYDLFVVAAYGKLIPKNILSIPRYGTLNIHPSLLPLYRGASPLQYQILDGAPHVGVSIMLLDEKMDHGPILMQESTPMPEPLPTCGELSHLLAEKGAQLLIETIPLWILGEITPQEQDHAKATFTKPIDKKDACIRLDDVPLLTYRKIQAYTPKPGAYYFHKTPTKEMRVKIITAHLEEDTLVITRVLPEGKKEMDYKDFLRGLQSS